MSKPHKLAANKTDRRKGPMSRPSAEIAPRSTNSCRSAVSTKMSPGQKAANGGEPQSFIGRSFVKMAQELSSNRGGVSTKGAAPGQKGAPKKPPEGSGRNAKKKEVMMTGRFGVKHEFKETDVLCGINNYKVVSLIHKSQRDVDLYIVKDADLNDEVRMKVSPMDSQHLKREAGLLQKLARLPGQRCFVSMLEYGVHSSNKIEFLVVSQFGATLNEILKMCGESFSLDCAIAVGLQMLKAIKDLHTIKFLHRNIRPAAFNCGLGHETTSVFLQDFRVARKYEEGHKHVAPKAGVKVPGTQRFSSRACHQHKELGRKDDLESWLYTLFYMIDANATPWKKEGNAEWVLKGKEHFMKNEGKQQYIKIPRTMQTAVTLVSGYEFASEPDYEALRRVLVLVQDEMRLRRDACDWIGKPNLHAVQGDTLRSFDNKLAGEGDANVEPSNRAGAKKETKKKPARKKLNPGDIIQNQASDVAWKVVSLLGSGGFGDVYKVHRKDEPASKCYALKTESEEGDKRILRLKVEVTVMMKTAEKRKTNNFHHFVEFVDRGKCEDLKCKYVVMGLVGPSLEDIRQKYLMSKFSVPTAFNVSIQTVKSLRDLHSIGYLHRDIKPANFAVGLGDAENVVYMLDFGIAKLFLDANGNHKKKRAKVKFLGTVRYASRACMELVEQGRKDDLETWIYLMFDLFDQDKGLPWKTMSDFKEICNAKKEFFHVDFTSAREIPKYLKGMNQLTEYVNKLDYDAMPDYDFIITFLDRTASDNGIKLSTKLDWVGRLKSKAAPQETESDKSDKNQSGEDED